MAHPSFKFQSILLDDTRASLDVTKELEGLRSLAH